MHSLSEVAGPFVEMAHRIVWATAATVDRKKRPRSRILHPIWQWDGERLQGFIATSATPVKRAHLEFSPHVSLNYWTPSHDTCLAECRTRWAFDDASCERVWNLFKQAPPPVGYDPALIPAWTSPTADSFSVLELDPWKLRVFPGTVLLRQGGEVLSWHE
jgi:hypothetical protein